MNPVTVIALCSLGISVLTTIIMLFGQRHTVKTTYVAQLEGRIEDLNRELEKCKARVAELESRNGSLMEENIALLRQIARHNA